MKLDSCSEEEVNAYAGSGFRLGTKSDLTNDRFSMNMGAIYNGMDLVNLDIYYGDEVLMAALPELSSKVFTLDPSDGLAERVKASPTVGPLLEESGIDVDEIVAYIAELQDVYKRQVFPDLSMEVRLDGDPVEKGDGSKEVFVHGSTFPCGGASFTSTMYGIPMGFENNYEKVTAAEALEKIPAFMNLLFTYNGGKPVYIDQFLFPDNTAGFEYNAKLLAEEKAAYLEGAAPIFKALTTGRCV